MVIQETWSLVKISLVAGLGAPGSPGFVWCPSTTPLLPQAAVGVVIHAQEGRGCGSVNKASVALTAFCSPERPSSDPHDLEEHRKRALMLGLLRVRVALSGCTGRGLREGTWEKSLIWSGSCVQVIG